MDHSIIRRLGPNVNSRQDQHLRQLFQFSSPKFDDFMLVLLFRPSCRKDQRQSYTDWQLRASWRLTPRLLDWLKLYSRLHFEDKSDSFLGMAEEP